MTLEGFYRALKGLGDQSGFAVIAVILPVNGIVAGAAPDTHPYPAEARRRLEALGIPYVDAFQIWAGAEYGARPFLPQGPTRT